VQGGDIVTGAGDGGKTALGGGGAMDTFADESFAVKLDKPGMLVGR